MKGVILIEFTRMPLIHVNAEAGAEWQRSSAVSNQWFRAAENLGGLSDEFPHAQRDGAAQQGRRSSHVPERRLE